MKRQRHLIFLEKAAALTAAVILILGLLSVLGLLRGRMSLMFLLILGAVMNALGVLRDCGRGLRLLQLLEISAGVLWASGALYLLIA